MCLIKEEVKFTPLTMAIDYKAVTWAWGQKLVLDQALLSKTAVISGNMAVLQKTQLNSCFHIWHSTLLFVSQCAATTAFIFRDIALFFWSHFTVWVVCQGCVWEVKESFRMKTSTSMMNDSIKWQESSVMWS